MRATEVRSTWLGICEVAGDHPLVITIVDGKVLDGFCASTTADRIQIIPGGKKPVTIERASVARMQMRHQRGQHLRSVPGDLRDGLELGIEGLGTPLAAVGIVMIPGTLAWAAIAVPVDAIRDLADLLAGSQDLKILP